MTSKQSNVAILLSGTIAFVLAVALWRRRQQDERKKRRCRFDSAVTVLNAPPSINQMLSKNHVHGVHFERRRFFQAHAQQCGLVEQDDKSMTKTMGQCCKIIHVAGTNGKGSVCEYIRTGLVHWQQRQDHQKIGTQRPIGMFTSPHMHSICERIQIGENPIPGSTLVRLVEQLSGVFAENPWMVPFDRLLTVALSAFGEAACGSIILETGIGGLLDSTNFLVSPTAVGITSVSLDHVGLLGKTIDAIAAQKAGIIKSSCPCFTPDNQNPTALTVLQAEACRKGTKVILCPPNASEGISGTDGKRFDQCLGRYSVAAENAGVAEAILRYLGREDAVPFLGKARWPGRFEIIKVPLRWRKWRQNNLHSSGGKGYVTVVLDGAHNEDSLRKLFAEVKWYFGVESEGNGAQSRRRRIICVFGANRNKTLRSMVSIVCSAEAAYDTSMIFVQSGHSKAAAVSELEAIAQEELNSVRPFSSASVVTNKSIHRGVEEGLASSIRIAATDIQGDASHDDPIVVVCGSLYVVSAAREVLVRDFPSLFPHGDPAHHAHAGRPT